MKLLMFFGWLYTIMMVLGWVGMIGFVVDGGKAVSDYTVWEYVFLAYYTVLMCIGTVTAFGWIKRKQWLPKLWWMLLAAYLVMIPFEWWMFQQSEWLKTTILSDGGGWATWVVSMVISFGLGIWIWRYRAQFDR